jgi:multidrug efflux pump subunit AcrB
VQRIPRLREDVKVLVRYPREDRSYEEALREMYISSGSSGSLAERVPLSSLVDIEYRKSYKKVERLDRKRVARVSSDVQRGFNAGAIIQRLQAEEIDALLDQYPDVVVTLKGEQQENDEFFQELVLFLLLSMMGIFAVMAIMFRSYWQPLLVLTAVPFGFMGAIYGHVIIGVNVSMFSVLGMMACAGVVVNDNVVLIDRINQLRRLGFSPRRAVVNGAVQRFRPIVLTSVTTFFGLTPILLESSVQAQFLIPMVTSLSFGVLFASVVTLVFVPALYLAGENASYHFTKRQARLDAALAEAALLSPPEANS